MTHHHSLLVVWVGYFVLLACSSAIAQSGGDYEQTWHSVDGGGAAISGGDYELYCTIGQPDAVELAGGDYLLQGGFGPGLDGTSDCNNNGIPDDVEIAVCDPVDPEYPGCDDCNLNGILDECDIASGESLDLSPADGVPDECYNFIAQCAGGDPAWSCGGNWNLAGSFPDNAAGVPNLSVTLDDSDLSFLDIHVAINTLRILDDAILQVTQTSAAGDLTVIQPGGILNQGSLFIGDGRTIDVSAGAFTVGPDGIYQSDPNAVGPVQAALTAGSVTVLGAGSGAPPSFGGSLGGTIILTGNMNLSSLSDLNMHLGPDKGSGTPPPSLSVTDDAGVIVALNLVMQDGAILNHASTQPFVVGGSVILGYGPDKGSGTPPPALNVSDNSTMQVGGNFINNSIGASDFNWAGILRFTDPVGFVPLPHTLEAAGADRGPCATGLTYNFALGTLELTAGAIVNVVNDFDNQQDGQATCDEAVYVGTLTLGAGAVLNTSGCKVYYVVLDNNGGSIPGLGTDVLEIGTTQAADLSCGDGVDAADLAMLLGCWGPCPCTGNTDCLADLTGDGVVNASDLALLLGSWG